MGFFSFGKKKNVPAGSSLLSSHNVGSDASKIQSDVISVAIHQLKTPLVGMKWSLKMMLNRELGPLSEPQESILSQCFQANEQIIATIDQILHANKVESGRFQLTRLNANICSILEQKIDELKTVATNKQITLKSDVQDSHVPLVFVDADKISSVLHVLIENAVRYTPEGGKVTVRITYNEKIIQVTVSDSGIGIPEDQKKNIFSKFYRAQNAIFIYTDGSGLGLYIAKDIVERHGGQIWFESKEGRGSDFSFTIPR